MKKSKIGLIIFFTVIVLIAVVFSAMYLSAANTKEYSKGKDYIPAITETVGKRTLTGVEHSNSVGGADESRYGYRSDTPLEDIEAYYKRLAEIDYIVTENNTTISSGTLVMAKQSINAGKIIIITMEYHSGGYSITVQKGTGTLDVFE